MFNFSESMFAETSDTSVKRRRDCAIVKSKIPLADSRATVA